MTRLLVLAMFVCCSGVAFGDGPAVDFARDIQPIFAKNCTSCHGEKKQKSGLRLDRKQEALLGGDSGSMLIAGKPDESELITRVTSDDSDIVMPPEGKLTGAEIALLRLWVQTGADWPDSVTATGEASAASTHWAFVAPKHPTPPVVSNPSWVRNPIDSFILAKLEAEGVKPAPEADRLTLLRRLHLDLTGLPPDADEVQKYEADQASDAYDRAVDRLLASPHFGERWGRHWLDLARYADSDGYEKDSIRPWAYRYRDWVINAFNRDQPYDQFTIEQLAGDLLPKPTDDQRVATGFHRNSLTNREGGVDPEEYRIVAAVDRTNTTGSIWLGLTVGCAQCHTHKYDPILQREYYGLFGFFNSVEDVDHPLPLPGETEAYEAAKLTHDAAYKPLTDAMEEYDRQGRLAAQSTWEQTSAAQEPRWVQFKPQACTSANGSTLEILPDNSIRAGGTKPDRDTTTVVVDTTMRGITAFRLEALPDPALPSKGPGRAENGNFVLTEFTVTASSADGSATESVAVPLGSPSTDFAQKKFAVEDAIDGDPKTGWGIAPRKGKRVAAVFEVPNATPTGETMSRLTFKLDQGYGDGHLIGRFRLSATKATPPVRGDGTPEEITEILAKPADTRTESEQGRVAEHHRGIDPEYQRLRRLVDDHTKQAPVASAAKIQGLVDLAVGRSTFIHLRGDFRRRGDEVQPGTLGVLPPLHSSSAKPNRLDLARWLVDPANPLPARVEMNRNWGHLFGRPLVTSVEDFGLRGETPSHPQLLDWLATEFIQQGWSRKAMIRLIVTSAAYRQSSANRPELLERDPNNVWVAHQARFRPEAEVIRDLALAASGLLDPKVGGPSVRPPQPSGITNLTYGEGDRWVESTGGDRYRRGLYTFFRRTSPYPMLITFDAPDSNTCAARRERSNTPLQALTMLNDAAFVECARAMAGQVKQAADPEATDEARVAPVFRACLAREPSAEETAILADLYKSTRASLSHDPAAAKELAGPDLGNDVNLVDRASWVVVVRALLNLDEFVTRE